MALFSSLVLLGLLLSVLSSGSSWVLPHDRGLWTEGLACRPSGRGTPSSQVYQLVESSGLPSNSRLVSYQFSAATGGSPVAIEKTAEVPLATPTEVFAEGTTFVDGRLLVATQSHGFAFSFDADDVQTLPKRLSFPTFANTGTSTSRDAAAKKLVGVGGEGEEVDDPFAGLEQLLGQTAGSGEGAGTRAAEEAKRFFDLSGEDEDGGGDGSGGGGGGIGTPSGFASARTTANNKKKKASLPPRVWGLAAMQAKLDAIGTSEVSPLVVASDGSNKLHFLSSDLKAYLGSRAVRFPAHVPPRPPKPPTSLLLLEDIVDQSSYSYNACLDDGSALMLNELEFVPFGRLVAAAKTGRAKNLPVQRRGNKRQKRQQNECLVSEYRTASFALSSGERLEAAAGEIWATFVFNEQSGLCSRREKAGGISSVSPSSAILRIDPHNGNALGWLTFYPSPGSARAADRAAATITSHSASHGDLNGIALCEGLANKPGEEPADASFVVFTGKNWPEFAVLGLDELVSQQMTACEIDYLATR